MSISSNQHHHHHHHRSSTSDHGRSSGRGNPTPETIQHRVMKSVSEYNRQLNLERKEDRRVCMDLQTYTIQYPVGLGRENKGLRRWIKKRRRISPLWRHGRRYPVALLPNQYQDWFLQYTPQELKYFPLNTVMHGPMAQDYDKLPALLQMSQNSNQNCDNSDSDIDGSDVLSDLDDDSTCSCGEVHCSSPSRKLTEPTKSMDSSQQSSNNVSRKNFDGNSSSPNLQYQNGHNNSNNKTNSSSVPNLSSESSSLNGDGKSGFKVCKVCKQNIISTVGIEEALCCADCGITSHPACLDISGELLEAIRLYRWQCQDCKSCQKCGHPHDEEKMMFCDKCDRGYHTYCVGLTDIPQGHWVCSLCAICANCGTKNPGSSGENSSTTTNITIKQSDNQQKQQWQHELIKIHSPDGQKLVRHSVFCETCYQLRKL